MRRKWMAKRVRKKDREMADGGQLDRDYKILVGI